MPNQPINLMEGQTHGGLRIEAATPDSYVLMLPEKGGALDIPALLQSRARYLVFFAEAMTENSLSLGLNVYTTDNERPANLIRFGLLPRLKTLICLDLNLLDGSVLFPERTPGELKLVCLGGRVERSDITRFALTCPEYFHDAELHLSEPYISDTPPAAYPIPDVKLVDAFGQNKLRDWPGKVTDEAALRATLSNAYEACIGKDGFAIDGWTTHYGGCQNLRLCDGTGFFGRMKKDGRWWLVDPEGYAFFSLGMDCVRVSMDCRVDGVEKLLDWLPSRDSEYGNMYNNSPRHAHYTQFSFERANLYRVFGADWYDKWLAMMPQTLRDGGINTIGNWSDNRLCAQAQMPYVHQLPEFPTTEKLIFRDFPDVLSDEYKQNAAQCAEALRGSVDDPYKIGYFLRNEPAWAFVDNLIIADEVLRSPEDTCCKTELIHWLAEKYRTIAALNAAWNREGKSCLADFDALGALHKELSREAVNNEVVTRKVSAFSAQAHEDMRMFSRTLLEAYVTIPTVACRAVDPNHMVLGMRWAWVSNADVIAGWENFDVFSVNCYTEDPLPNIDRVVEFGVDLPIMIGEFHFGALDCGPTSTGLRAVRTQADRAKAYRYYCERLATHSHGVGCHYFQCYDQFALGRFDGENYNIGVFDICSQPYAALYDGMRATGTAIYPVRLNEQAAYAEQADFIPTIAF